VADADLDRRARFTAITRLREKEAETGGSVRHADVVGLNVDGLTFALLDRGHGIIKPSFLDAAIAFRSTLKAGGGHVYIDTPGEDGLLRYAWQGSGKRNWMNDSMRAAQEDHLPLIWFREISTAVYTAIYPMFVVGEDEASQHFVIAFDELQAASAARLDPIRKRYATQLVRQRLHQPMFRARILAAYETRCAVCGLHPAPLLDAAHILGDAEEGEASERNGIALCKTHHAAFDAHIFGIDPDRRIHVRSDLLEPSDEPSLGLVIQQFDGTVLNPPSRRKHYPDRALLASRFERFQAVRAG
jgi:putative restriction endonuclease